jgi:hypothetical protein
MISHGYVVKHKCLLENIIQTSPFRFQLDSCRENQDKYVICIEEEEEGKSTIV